jgi:hypothetical protein
MVCASCEKKQAKIATPDVVKAVDKRPGGSASEVRKVGINKLLERKAQDKKISSNHKCKSCQCSMTSQGKYCARCAYYNGLCAICGKKTVDNSEHRMGQTLW